MRTIGVITVGRSDYSIYLPLLKKLKADPEVDLHLVVAGMHLLPQFGLTVEEIEKDGFEIRDRVELPLNVDSPEGIANSIGSAVTSFSKVFKKRNFDLVFVLGDRFEMHAAALAALPFKIPMAHISGGELTRGAFDDALRHCLTKMSHLHFVSTEAYRQRVLQLGEEPSRVFLSGALALDHLQNMQMLSKEVLAGKWKIDLDKPPLLVTYHPVTLEYEETESQMSQLLAALEEFDLPIIFTGTNADTSNQIIRQMTENFVRKHARAHFVNNLGMQNYFSMLSLSCAMVGNSSSGLVEAPSFELPVVNIGTRQEGRVRAKNVLDVGYGTEDIITGIQKALSPSFREGLKEMVNPHGDGKAAQKIMDVLRILSWEKNFVQKKFYDCL